MPKRHQKSNQKFRINNIIDRLPLNKQLLASSAEKNKLTTVWHEWAHRSLNAEVCNKVSINSYTNNQAVIYCEDSAIASQLKHFRQTILEHFHAQGFREIKRIDVRIAHPTLTSFKPSIDQSKLSTETNRSLASENTVKSIQACEKIIQSEQLSNSLRKLAQTLKNDSKR